MPQEPLTEPEKARAYIGKKNADDDTLIDDMIKAASSMIRDHTGRRFSTPPTVEARDYPVRGALDRLYVDEVFEPSQIVSVTAPDVTLSPVSYEAVSTDYSLKKGLWLYFGGAANLPLGSYPPDHSDWFIREFSGGPPTEYFVPGVVRVTAEFGWEEIPAEIEFMTRTCVKYWYETQVAHFGRQFDAAEGRIIFPEHLPSSVLKGLEAWVSSERYAFA